MTTAGGYRIATSIGGVITGRGAHVAILDDPIKAADAGSDVARNAAYEWFKVALMSRFDKPAEARIVVIAQRLHQDDLIGRLRDEGGWTILEMPGEAWREQIFELGDGKRWVFRPGDFLFAERFAAKHYSNFPWISARLLSAPRSSNGPFRQAAPCSS